MLLPCVASAKNIAGYPTVDGWDYTVYDDGTAELTSAPGATGAVVIPETITYESNTYTVTRLGFSLFDSNVNITAIQLPSGLKELGGRALAWCTNLETVTGGPEELEKVPYRTKRALPWPVRIVEVPGYDICACCGVHVAATGEIGLIKLLSAIPCRGGTRIEMAAGRAAFDLMNVVFDQNRQVSRLLSAQLTQTAQGTEQLLDTLNGWKYRSGALERQLFAYQAAAMEGMGDCFFFADGLNPEGLRNLTDQASAKTGGIAAGFSKNENGFHYVLALPGGDLRGLNKELTAALNGRGGGKPNFQQGSVKAEEREIQAFFEGKGFKKGKI